MRIYEEKIKGVRGTVYEFDDLHELVTWSKKNHRKNGYSFVNNDPSFFGDNGYEEAVRDALNGNVKRTDYFAGILDNVKTLVRTEKTAMTHDVTGEILDIGAYLSGEPECFMRRNPRPDKPVVRVAVDMAFSAGNTSERINRRGAAIVALIDELQNMGFYTEVRVLSRVSFRKKSPVSVKCLVRCDPVDVDSFATMCSSSYLRRFVISVYEVYYGEDWPEYSHGTPAPLECYECESEDDFLFKNDSDLYGSDKLAKDIVLKMLEMHNAKDNSGCVTDRDAYMSL